MNELLEIGAMVVDSGTNRCLVGCEVRAGRRGGRVIYQHSRRSGRILSGQRRRGGGHVEVVERRLTVGDGSRERT